MTEPIAWSRWLAKKAARTACLMAPGERAAGVRVLMYHRVRARGREPFSVSPEAFARQMAWLASEGRAVSLSDFAAGLRGEGPLRPGAVLVTIDDGFRDTYTTALPILQRYGVPAVLFVTVGAIEDRSGDDDAHVSWSELAALDAGGVAVCSHAWTHRSMARLPAAEMDDELHRSRETLRERLGVAATAFAYPFGTRADYSAATGAAVERAGYTMAFTAQHGAIAGGDGAFELPRIKVEGGEGLWMFRRLVAGGLDRWSTVDRYLWRMQASAPDA